VKVVRVARAVEVEVKIADIGSAADISNVSEALVVARDLREDTAISLARGCGITLADVAFFDGAGESVGVHRGAGGFEPIAGYGGFIDDFVPEAGRGILIFFIGCGQLAHKFNQVATLSIVVRQYFQHFDEGHAVPSNGTAPENGGVVGVGLGPRLLSRLVVRMVEKTAGGIVQVFGIDQELLYGFIAGVLLVVECYTVTDKKRHGHVHAIEPKLVLTRKSVPKAAVGGAGIGVETMSDAVGGDLVFLLTGLLEKDEKEVSGEHIVEGVDGAINLAGRIDVVIHPAPDVVEILFVASTEVDQVLAIQIQRNGITPAAERRGIGLAMHGGFDDSPGPVKVRFRSWSSTYLRARDPGACGGYFCGERKCRTHREEFASSKKFHMSESPSREEAAMLIKSWVLQG